MQTTLAFIGGFGGWEILLIILVIVIFFGAKKIPELARGLGKGLREFKDATNEIKNDIELNDNHQQKNPNSARTSSEPSTRSTDASLKAE